MKYWFGYLTAAIFGAITWVLLQFGERFSVLVDMVYPYVIRTLQSMLAEWTSAVAFPVWQVLAVALGMLVLCSVVLMVVLKWNPIQWLGWVLAVFAGIYMLHTMVWGLNYYAGDLSDDMRLEVTSYTIEDLAEAAEYYRDKANALAPMVPRDAAGNVEFTSFTSLAEAAGEGFTTLTYEYHYSIFAGSTLPVKELGWSDMYTSMGITGVTFGLTGEACVNPQIPDVSLPFTMCHEMAHRMCIATERDANFAAFLACSVHSDVSFQYSAYFMAYRYCYSALSSVSTQSASTALARVSGGVSDLLKNDLNHYTTFFLSHRDRGATEFADTVNDAYLKTSGQSEGINSYAQVCDLLVNWYIQTVYLPTITVEESHFDPYDENWVKLPSVVNGG